eukprot:3619782-Pyramimonas_sp.AAC.1
MGAPKEGTIISFLPLPDERTSQATLNTSQHMEQPKRSQTPHPFENEHNAVPHDRPLTLVLNVRDNLTQGFQRRGRQKQKGTGRDLIKT